MTNRTRAVPVTPFFVGGRPKVAPQARKSHNIVTTRGDPDEDWPSEPTVAPDGVQSRWREGASRSIPTLVWWSGPS